MSALGAIAIGLSFIAVFLGAHAILARHANERRLSIVYCAALLIVVSSALLLAKLGLALHLGAYTIGGVFAISAFVLRAHIGFEKSEKPHAISIVLSILITVLVLYATWFDWFFDEHAAHIPLANVLALGIVPPEHPYYPGEVFRYHYAFSALTAIFMNSANIGVVRAIDVVTTLCWFAFLLVSLDMGRALAGRLGGSIALVLIPFGSSVLLHLVYTRFGSLEFHALLPQAWYDDWSDEIPPVISNFFQHPQGLGMPSILAALLLLNGDADDRALELRRFAFGAVLLGMISIAQVIQFSVFGFAMGCAALYTFAKTRDFFRLAFETLMLLLALALGFLLGGFLEWPIFSGESLIRFGTPYFTDAHVAKLFRHVVVFGLPLLLLPFTFSRFKSSHSRLRLSLLVAIGVGLLMPNIASYERSWDIVKFYAIAALAMNILTADLIAAHLPKLRLRAAIPVGLILFALLTWSSWIWLLRYSIFEGRWGVPQHFFPPALEVGLAVREHLKTTANWQPQDRVMTTNRELGLGAGLFTPGVVRGSNTFAIDEAVNLRYADALGRARHHLGADDLETLGVRFVVMSDGDLNSLTEDAKSSLEDPTRFRSLGPARANDGQIRHCYEVLKP